jgi:hypothetical protein
MEAQQIRELYGYNLGVIDLRKEVIRLNNIIKENEEMSKNDTNKPSNDVERMRHIMKLHQSCIV